MSHKPLTDTVYIPVRRYPRKRKDEPTNPNPNVDLPDTQNPRQEEEDE